MISFILAAFLSISLLAPADPHINDEIEDLLNRAEEKFENKDEQGALELYLQVLDKDSENYEALWNASLNYSRIGFRFDDEEDQERYFEKAIELAEKSLELYPEKGKPHYVKAVALGRMADLISTRDRISTAHDIRDYADKAIELDPNYAPAWHLLGVWHSEVANVGRAERTAARFISQGIPDGASNETAEEYLEKAIDLDPDNIITRLDLARHYLRAGEDEKAIPVLEEILDMEPIYKDDPEHLEEAEELLSNLL